MTMKNSQNNKTSIGGFIFLGLILIAVLSVLTVEQYRKYGERKALKYGIETTCIITEIHNVKTEFVRYCYKVNERNYYSDKATPFSSIIPGERFYLKYLKESPKINMIQFDKPLLTDLESIKIKGRIVRIKKNNEAVFDYKYQGKIYERWQLLRQNHSLTTNDSVDIAIHKDKPEIGIIRY
jgi:hypothetical protein